MEGTTLRCAHERAELEAGGVTRRVFWQVPLGEPREGGWPIVIVFQPSIYWAEAHWTGFTDVGGQRFATETIKALLDAGFAVLTPQAQALADSVWETNVPPYSGDWGTSHDHALMLALFDGIAAGTFGALNETEMFATGMSSGGYMTSRMALSYPGRFRALAVQSAAWATCAGPVNTHPTSLRCEPPDTLPGDHPPTLFVHGTWDGTVGVSTMRRYADALVILGAPVRRVEVARGGHEFFEVSPAEILGWFETYRR